ncbi:MAG: PHB depolymerase family esterase [Rubrivivax sp.]|nr:MAG: PHB depolymerase family esterase [Rubrivivax sp.]
MNPLLQQLMGDAAKLTQAGDLQGAMAAIQAALGQPGRPAPNPPKASPFGDVIDVQAREVFEQFTSAWLTPDKDTTATPKPEPQPESPTATPRQATPHADAFISGRHIGHHGARGYKLYVPPAFQAGQALPLVVMLHGCTQNPDDFALGTGMNEAARAQGFFVLYPEQDQHANAQRCWNWFKHNHQQRGKGEPALLAGMTREVMAQYGIDPKRVYVAGLSAGGAMAAILGDAYPELFAAVGVHSGLATGSATDVSSAFAAMKGGADGMPMDTGLSNLPGLQKGPARRAKRPARPASGVPTIVFHGDRDTTVHPVNGEQVLAACVVPEPQARRERSRSRNGRDYTRHWHRDTNGRVMAEHWVVHGAGHAWSGGHPQGTYTDAKGPDATQEMLRFFFEQSPR